MREVYATQLLTDTIVIPVSKSYSSIDLQANLIFAGSDDMHVAYLLKKYKKYIKYALIYHQAYNSRHALDSVKAAAIFRLVRSIMSMSPAYTSSRTPLLNILIYCHLLQPSAECSPLRGLLV